MFIFFNKINFQESANKIVDESKSFMSTQHYRVLKKKFDYILCGELKNYNYGSYKGEYLGIKLYPQKMECYIIKVKHQNLENYRVDERIKVINKSKFCLSCKDGLYKEIVDKIDIISINNTKKDLKQTIYLYSEDLIKKENEIAEIFKKIKDLTDGEQSWNSKNGDGEKISMKNAKNEKEEEIKKLLKDKMRFAIIIKKSKVELENLDKEIDENDELLKISIYGKDDK